MGYGVIGSPTGSGPVSLGSSPGTPATCESAATCEGSRASVSSRSAAHATAGAGRPGGPLDLGPGLGRPAGWAPGSRLDPAAAPMTALESGHAEHQQDDDGADDRAEDADCSEMVGFHGVILDQLP
jgi:hypothetical protein